MNMDIKYIISPGIGLDKLAFGMNRDEVSQIIGKPDETDMDTEEGFTSEMWIYSGKNITLFFEGEDLPVLVCVEAFNPDTLLFGEKVFGMTERSIIDMMQKNGYKEVDTEDENWGERRVSFDDAMIDFYFENGKLNTVNWSIITEDDED
jgi:hypothetical protein